MSETNLEVARESMNSFSHQPNPADSKSLTFKPMTQKDIETIKANMDKSPFKISKMLDDKHDVERIEIKMAELQRDGY